MPAVVYDVGGLAEPVRALRRRTRRAGRGRRGADAAARELLGDGAGLDHTRRRPAAREELTWDAAAAAHLSLYESVATRPS